jgi:ParB family chromosome partitioning protein
MQLEFHQLDRRWEHLRVRQPHRQRRLMASLAECGQQTPIIVVLSAENRERYLVIDGHKRIAALQRLGRDTVEATVWAMSEAEALLLERSLRLSPQESALEQGWLLTEMEQRYGYSLECWGGASTAAGVGYHVVWGWWSYCRKRSSSKCAKASWRRNWR